MNGGFSEGAALWIWGDAISIGSIVTIVDFYGINVGMDQGRNIQNNIPTNM